MRVGTKLGAILLAPLVVLGVLAGLGIADRADRASGLRAAELDVILAGRDDELNHALQVERIWAVATLTGADPSSARNLANAIEASGRAAALLDVAIGDLGSVPTEVDDRVSTVADRLAEVDALRPSITSGQATVESILFRYGLASESLVSLLASTSGTQIVSDLAQDLRFILALSRAKNAVARADTLVLALNAPSNEAERSAQVSELQDTEGDAERHLKQFFEEADPEFRALLRNALASSEARTTEALKAEILAGETIDETDLAAASVARLTDMLALSKDIEVHIAGEAREERAAANRTARLYLAGAGLGILAAVALAYLVARSITRPLRRLTEAADRISTEQLPALVSQLQAGSGDVALQAEPIDLKSRDELGQLAAAFNNLQRVTVEVAQEQSALLRKGISDIFVNLARRNQALLDRQIEFIDQLEANERDPDQLENLFRLDHLATRMRRNAESLLVLAGADPTRRRGRPVPLADVVRVAVGEVADYSRIRVRTLDEVTINASVSVDVAHLLAELMENATQFSPPSTSVEVQGGFGPHGDYVVMVTDRGIGMSAEAMAEANELLVRPPIMGLDMGRSLGFVVIGRLAQRHGVAVQLHAAPIGGVSAAVRLPIAALGSQLASPGEGGGMVARRNLKAGQETTSSPDYPAGADPIEARSTATNGTVGVSGSPQAGPNGAATGPDSATGGDAAGVTGHGLPDRPGKTPSRATQTVEQADAVTNGQPTAGEGAESFTYHEFEDDYRSLFPSDTGSSASEPLEPTVEQPVAARRAPYDQAQPDHTFKPTAAEPVRAVAGGPFDVTETEHPHPEEFAQAGFTPLVLPPLTRPGAVDREPIAPLLASPPWTSPPPAAAPPVDSPPVEPPTGFAPPAESPMVSLPVEAPTVSPPSMFSSASMTQTYALLPREPGRDGDGGPGLGDKRVDGDGDDTLPASSLPSRRPRLPVLEPQHEDRLPPEPAAPDGETTLRRQSLASGLPSRRPTPQPAPGPVPEPAAVEPARNRGSESAPSRPGLEPAGPTEAGVGADVPGDNITAAGLVRRSPKQQLRAMARGESGPAAMNRTAASQRSPEEVRKMLYRYRSGLQRGRTLGGVALGPDDPPTERDESAATQQDPTQLSSAHEHAAEELPWRP